VVDLYPASSVRGEGSTAPTVPAGAERVTVILRAPGLPAFADYGIEIRRADGSTVWSEDGFKPTYSSFTLSLPRDRLGDGIRLVGIGPKGERQTIGEYALPKGP
jgi:hypothetical protein